MTTDIAKPRIGEMLISSGLITQEDLDKALEEQHETGDRVVNILIRMGALSSRTFIEFLAEPGSYAAVELKGMSIDPSTIALVSKEFALSNEVVPVSCVGTTLTLAMMCPLDQHSIENLEKETGLQIKPVLGAAEDVQAAVRRYYGTERSTAHPRNVADPLTRDECWTALEHTNGMPVLPETVEQIKAYFYRGDGDTTDIIEALKSDPGLAVAILVEANHATRGIGSPLVTIEEAVAVVSPVRLYAIACAASTLDDPEYRMFADYAAATGRFTEALTESLLTENNEWGLAAGLLYPLGRAALARLGVEASPCPDITMGYSGAEDICGVVSPTEASHRLLTLWGLPDTIGAAIQYATDPLDAPEEWFEAAAIVYLAHQIASQWIREGTWNIDALKSCSQVLSMLHWTPEECLDVIQNADPTGMALA